MKEDGQSKVEIGGLHGGEIFIVFFWVMTDL
jgi:hypothetical protein